VVELLAACPSRQLPRAAAVCQWGGSQLRAAACSTGAFRRAVRRHHAVGATRNGYFLVTGTGMPGILTLTAPRWLRLAK
jgi:hypothetical protein